MRKRGQSWSMDLVIAVVVFGFIAVIFYSLLMIQQKPSIDELRDRAQTIQERLASGSAGCGSITENQTVTQEQLQCLYGLTPDQLRQKLNVRGNFCIYIEDANNTVLVVRNSTTPLTYMTGVGDSALIVAGTNCGEKI